MEYYNYISASGYGDSEFRVSTIQSFMKRIFTFTIICITLFGCVGNSQVTHAILATPTKDSSQLADKSVWSIYDSDQNHPWNRVFRQFYRRVAIHGQEYGMDELDPLLWFDTTYLLTGPSHQQAVQVLDEFLNTHAETLIREPLKRAVFQRDMWAVFDWLAFQSEPYP